MDRNQRSNFPSLLSVQFFSRIVGLMLLGLCSSSGGMATYLADQEKNGSIDNEAKQSINAKKLGAGWACFWYLVASILTFAGSIMYSPTLFGSNMEKNTLSVPVDIEPLRPSLAPGASSS